ncbi:MAG TPA: GAF domain-containing sensor histidine kinase [Actinomycetes bacterium]|nr:GAF domain-containing sensor histidine kinase [Actinomycetes bacterium]
MSATRAQDQVPDVLLDAVLGIAADLELAHALRRIVEAAVSTVDARYGALGVLGPGGGIAEFITTGLDEEVVAKIGDPPRGNGILGLLIRTPEPIRLADLTSHPDSVGFPAHHPPMRSFLGVPIRVGNDVFGNLYLTEKQGGGEFTERDERLVVTWAAAAGVAIGLNQARAEQERLALLEERDRIGRDLHDLVIQRLFATGMLLQGVQRLTEDAEVGDRIARAVDEIDQTIREVRSTIFALQHTFSGGGLRSQVLREISGAASTLGFEPTVRFDGPIDSLVTDEVREHVIAALREALSNAARHAEATEVRVSLSVDSGEVVLLVTDDGRGIPPDVEPSGLANLASRAESAGGSFVAEPGTDAHGVTSGTRLTWRAPVAGATAH